jgi:hypothetical protein
MQPEFSPEVSLATMSRAQAAALAISAGPLAVPSGYKQIKLERDCCASLGFDLLGLYSEIYIKGIKKYLSTDIYMRMNRRVFFITFEANKLFSENSLIIGDNKLTFFQINSQ